SKTGAELLFKLISQRYERGSTLITSNLPFDEWTETFGSERLTGALLDWLTHHVTARSNRFGILCCGVTLERIDPSDSTQVKPSRRLPAVLVLPSSA
uniref:ATP-binding protein n=1 Tax=Paracoccus sp. FO-3 TaxID=1335059 RepID=UPI0021064BD5